MQSNQGHIHILKMGNGADSELTQLFPFFRKKQAFKQLESARL